MDRETVTSVYISPWSVRDPLCEGQTLAYLRGLTAFGHRFALITFEHKKYALSEAARDEARRELLAQGIHWYPLTSHPGSSVPGKLIDCASGVALGTYVAMKHQAAVVHGRSTYPGGIAMVVARACGLKFIYDADCDMSQECLDTGVWRETDLIFKAASSCERIARGQSDSTIVLTEDTRAKVAAERRASSVTVIPCCVDVSKFRFDEHQRSLRRAEIGVSDERVFVYLGKIGSWYLVDEMFALFSAAARRTRAHLLVISPDPPSQFDAIALRQGVARDAYTVRSASQAGVAEWLSAGDVGLSLIASLESKRGCSPVKVGEYLAMGLPVLITPGIGDYTGIVRDERVGVVVDDRSPVGYERVVSELEALWSDQTALRARCRQAAENHVSLSSVGVRLYRDIYAQMVPSADAGIGSQATPAG